MVFYNSIAPFYEAIFPFNQAQLSFINKALANHTNALILDVGCGVGTLLQELDKHYTLVYGIDFDEEMIALAKKRVYKNKPTIVCGNMLHIRKSFTNKAFNSIVCFGNTLVHLPSSTHIEEFIIETYRVLEPRGKLLLQIINYDRIIENQIDHLPTIDNEKITFVRKYELLENNSKVNFKTQLTIKTHHQILESEQTLISLRSEHLAGMLKNAGYHNIKLFGGFNYSEFNINSIPLVIEAEK